MDLGRPQHVVHESYGHYQKRKEAEFMQYFVVFGCALFIGSYLLFKAGEWLAGLMAIAGGIFCWAVYPPFRHLFHDIRRAIRKLP